MFVICAKTGNACTNTDCHEAGCVQKRRENQGDLLDRLRTEADLCRNETATDIANLLDEAAVEMQRLQSGLAGIDGIAKRRAAEIERLRGAIVKQRGALNQARFCLRELLPDDADAKFTVGIINTALALVPNARVQGPPRSGA
jgi:hypothetical protein